MEGWTGRGVANLIDPTAIITGDVRLGTGNIIGPQTITLVHDGRTLRVGTDGLHPFAIRPGF